jgi:SAM-dependent methyltransferase
MSTPAPRRLEWTATPPACTHRRQRKSVKAKENTTVPYDQDSVHAYELLYVGAAGKDYEQEAKDLTALIGQRNPGADSLLDVACGPGLHLAHLRHTFGHVEGLEISPAMRDAATARLPGINIHAGDMRSFQLGRTYSAITCLFSSIGYTESENELRQAIHCFAAHLQPRGVLLLEPWHAPQEWSTGSVHAGGAGDGHRHVTRMCYSHQTGTTSIMTMHYLLGQAGTGIRHWAEEHTMSLFTDEQYHDAMWHAGLRNIEWLPGHGQLPRIAAIKP